MRRDEALEVLALGRDADARTVRHRFRTLAREHHPDRGGDPERFAELHRAYAALRDLPTPTRPAVSRGRPSRRAATASPAVTATTAVAATVELAGRLAAAGPAERDGSGHRLRLVSVAPGARRNRLVAALPEASLARLELSAGTGRAGVRLVVRSRAARRAVVALPLDVPALTGSWTRRRGDAAVELRCELARATAPAEAAAGAAVAVLTALRWPLAEWSPEPAD